MRRTKREPNEVGLAATHSDGNCTVRARHRQASLAYLVHQQRARLRTCDELVRDSLDNYEQGWATILER